MDLISVTGCDAFLCVHVCACVWEIDKQTETETYLPRCPVNRSERIALNNASAEIIKGYNFKIELHT